MNSSALFADSLQLLGLLAVEVTLVTTAAALLARWTKSAAWRRAVWQAGLVALLVLTGCELSGSARWLADWAVRLSRTHTASVDSLHSSQPPASQVTGEFRSKVEARIAAESRPSPRRPFQLRARERIEQVSSEKIASARPTTGPSAADSIHVLWLWLIWAAGTVMVGARAWLGRCLLFLFRLRRRPVTDPALSDRVHRLSRALGMRRPVRVIESARLSGPIAFGLLHPTIGLPRNYSATFAPARQEAMLAHELAHLTARDPAWSLLADFSAALLWWHPAAWWARRQFNLASELVADEASLVVKDGPAVLAECLLELGTRLAGGRPLGELQVSGLRSHLGRRVHRLLRLQTPGAPPARLRATLLLTLGPLALAALVVLCTAWTTPRALRKGNIMPSTHLTWKRSLATFALLAAFHSQDAAEAAADPGKSTPHPASVTPADTAWNAPVTGAPPRSAASRPAENPLAGHADAAQQAFLRRYGLNVPAAGTSVNTGSSTAVPDAKRQKIEAKLDETVLPEIAFDGLPLTDVIKVLSDQSIKLDPEKKGINFLLSQNSTSPSPWPQIDPSTGLPMPQEQWDISQVTIKFSLPLRNVSLKDTLEAVVRVADRPIEYAVEDYGVVISPNLQANVPVSASAPAEQLVACTFKVDTNTFLAGLENAFGVKVPVAVPEQPERHTREIQTALQTLLAQLGVNPANAGTVFYNDLTGMVMVRARQSEEGVIQAVIETLGGTPSASYSTGSGSGGGGLGLSTPGHR